MILWPKSGLQVGKKCKIHVIRNMDCVRLGSGAVYFKHCAQLAGLSPVSVFRFRQEYTRQVTIKKSAFPTLRYRVCFEQILVLYPDKNIPAVKSLLGIYYSVHKTPKTVVQYGSQTHRNHTVVHPVTNINPLHSF